MRSRLFIITALFLAGCSNDSNKITHDSGTTSGGAFSAYENELHRMHFKYPKEWKAAETVPDHMPNRGEIVVVQSPDTINHNEGVQRMIDGGTVPEVDLFRVPDVTIEFCQKLDSECDALRYNYLLSVKSYQKLVDFIADVKINSDELLPNFVFIGEKKIGSNVFYDIKLSDLGSRYMLVTENAGRFYFVKFEHVGATGPEPSSEEEQIMKSLRFN